MSITTELPQLTTTLTAVSYNSALTILADPDDVPMTPEIEHNLQLTVVAHTTALTIPDLTVAA